MTRQADSRRCASKPRNVLRHALAAILDMGRARPHAYRVMFMKPPGGSKVLAQAQLEVQKDCSADHGSSVPTTPTVSRESF